MEIRLWALIATLALLFGLCQSQNTLNTLDARQGDPFDAEFPEWVYRGETGRSPADVEKDGGFYARGVQKQKAGTTFSPKEVQEGSSLFHHAGGETAEFTRYISTSTDPSQALTFAIDDEKPAQKGYIYKIHTNKNMVDVNRSLGKYSPYKGQKEHAAAGYISYDQIEGWWSVTYKDNFENPTIGKETQQKLREGKMKGFEKNPKYKKSTYQKLKSSGAAPQLAGFPRESPAWGEETWKQYKTQPVDKNLDDFITSACGGKGKRAKRDANCLAQLGHQESTGPAKPKPNGPKRPLTPGGPDGKPKKPQGSTKRPPSSRPSSKLKLPKAVGQATFITLVAPHARYLLEEVKKTNTFVGTAVSWLDGRIADVQEVIGGPQRDDVDGNNLKARLICALKGGKADDIIAGRPNTICTAPGDKFKEQFKRDFAEGKLDSMIEMCRVEPSDVGHPGVVEWTRQYCDAFHRTNEYAQRMWEMAIEALLKTCSEPDMEDKPAESDDLRDQLKKHCTTFGAAVDKVEEAAANALKSISKTCKCNDSELPKPDDRCYKVCRAVIVQQRAPDPKYTHCDTIRHPPHPNPEYQKELLKINCPPEFWGQEAQPEPEPEAPKEPPRQCSNSSGPIPCGGGQTEAELETGVAVCRGCGFAWDPEAGICRDKNAAVLWPPASTPVPDMDMPPTPSGTCQRPSGEFPCGGGQTPEELKKGWAVCRACGFAWDPEGGECKDAKAKVIWPEKS